MNRIRYYLSYLFEVPIQQLESVQSGRLSITLHKGQLKLTTDRVVYSFGKHYHSFSRAFEKIEVQNREVKNVLILGAGMGSILNLLENHPTIAKITAVENDPIILDAAVEFHQSTLRDKTKWVLGDAYSFIQDKKEQYDLVLFDVFVHERTPKQFLNKAFVDILWQSLSREGVVIFSKMSNLELMGENDDFKSVFQSVFEHSEVLHLYGNVIFIGYNQD